MFSPMKLYISIPISGRPLHEAKYHAECIKAALTPHGHECITPFDVCPEPGKTYGYYMGRDIVAALRIVANPRDELAWQRYLCLFPRIGEITAAKIIDRVLEKDTLGECLEELTSNAVLDPSAAITLAAIKKVEVEVNLAVAEALKGLTAILRQKYRDDWERRRPDVVLLEKIGEASESLTAFIADYILDPSLSTAVKNESDATNCVVLTTIHSAKGLEAKNCYLVNVNYNQYPSPKAVANGENAIEEDRRCLYVALTRAKDRLVIYRNHRATQVAEDRYTRELDMTHLYFLNNLPTSLYTFEDITDTKHSWDTYRGAGISLSDCDDFDFS